MKNKKIIAGILIWLVLGLTACGDGALEWDALVWDGINWDSLTEAPPEAVKVTAEVVEEKEPDRETILLSKYGTSACSNEEYIELAQIYMEQSRYKDARDVLELSCRLGENPEGYELLQQLVVNIAEEDETIRKMSENLLWNMDAEALFGEAIAMLYHNSWSQTMMPKMETGVRNYYLKAEERELYVQTGFDSCGGRKNTVWHVESSNVVVIVQTEGAFQVIKTGLKDGSYDGTFESWRISLENSDVWNETGTFVAGQCQGEYRANVRFGKSQGDVLSLWDNREMFDYVSFQGAFDEAGDTLVKQPEELEGESVLVYAYADDKQNYLSVDETIVTKGFNAILLGCSMYPEYVPYTVEENGMTEENGVGTPISVRVLDGRILVFDGTIWRDFGEVDAYVKADPLYSGSKNVPKEENEWEDVYAHLKGGKLKKALKDIWVEKGAEPTAVPTATPTAEPTATPAATPSAKPTTAPSAKPTTAPSAKPTAAPSAKPTAAPTAKPTAAPAVNPTAAPTAKPTAAPTAKPTAAPTAKPTAAPTPAPTAAPTPAPTPDPTPEPTQPPNDNETDVEWTPDLM